MFLIFKFDIRFKHIYAFQCNVDLLKSKTYFVLFAFYLHTFGANRSSSEWASLVMLAEIKSFIIAWYTR